MAVTGPGAGALLALCGVWAVALASPGPDFFLVMHRGVVKGVAGALAAAVGVVVGIEIWISRYGYW